MSTYTMTLAECFDMWVGRETNNTRDKIEAGRTKLFDFDYPIFDQNYKKVLETHFIRKFYMREIGFETEGLFKFQLETWLLINMPYFNKLFESENLKFDPLSNTKIDTTHNRKNDRNQDTTSKTSGSSSSNNSQTASGTTTTDNFGRHLESDTPDTRLAITTNDGQGVIEYASQIQENTENDKKTSSSSTSGNSSDKSDVTNTGNASINETEDYIESKIGKIGTQSYSSMMNEYRSSLLRIENKMFEEMQELFMLVY